MFDAFDILKETWSSFAVCFCSFFSDWRNAIFSKSSSLNQIQVPLRIGQITVGNIPEDSDAVPALLSVRYLSSVVGKPSH